MIKNFVKDFLVFGNLSVQREYNNVRERTQQIISGLNQILDFMADDGKNLLTQDSIWENIFNLPEYNKNLFNDKELGGEYEIIINRLIALNQTNNKDYNLLEIKKQNGEKLFAGLVDNNFEQHVKFWMKKFGGDIFKASWFKDSLGKSLVAKTKNIFLSYLLDNNLISYDTKYIQEDGAAINLINLCYMPDSFNTLIGKAEEKITLEKDYFDKFFNFLQKENKEHDYKPGYISMDAWFSNVISKTNLSPKQKEEISFNYILTLLKIGYTHEVEKLITENPRFSHYKPEKGKEGLILWHEALVQGLDSFVMIPINDKKKFAPPLTKDQKNREEVCHFFNLISKGHSVRVAKHLNHWWKYYFSKTDVAKSRDSENNNLLGQYLSLENFKTGGISPKFLSQDISENGIFLDDFKGRGITTSSARNVSKSAEWIRNIFYFLQDKFQISILEKNDSGIMPINYLLDKGCWYQNSPLFIEYLKKGDNYSTYGMSKTKKIIWEGLEKADDKVKNDFWDGMAALYNNMSAVRLKRRMEKREYINRMTSYILDLAYECKAYPNEKFLRCDKIQPFFENLAQNSEYYSSERLGIKNRMISDQLKYKIESELSEKGNTRKFKL